MKDATRKREEKNAGRRGKRRPVHGRSLQHVENAIRNRARDAREQRSEPCPARR